MNRFSRLFLVCFTALAWAGSAVFAHAQSSTATNGWPGAAQPADATAWGTAPFTPQAQWAGAGQITLTVDVRPGHLLYRHQLAVVPSPGWTVDPVQWPAGQAGPAGLEVFTRPVQTQIRLHAQDPQAPLTLDVRFQGCTDTGVCHPPERVSLAMPAPSSKPTLVVLSGPWCGPCQAQDRRMQDPTLQKALANFQVVRMDVPNDDTANGLLSRYGVVGVPALRVYGPGVPVSAQGGLTLLGEQTLTNLQTVLRQATSGR